VLAGFEAPNKRAEAISGIDSMQVERRIEAFRCTAVTIGTG